MQNNFKFSAELDKSVPLDDKSLTISFLAIGKEKFKRYDPETGKDYYISIKTEDISFKATKLYLDHEVDFKSAIGSIVDKKLEDGNWKIKVQFYKDIPESYQAFLKYKNGLSESVSVGFGDALVEKKENFEGLEHIEIVKGEIYEVSAVWEGAYPKAKITNFKKEGKKMKNDNAILDKEQEVEVKAELNLQNDKEQIIKFANDLKASNPSITAKAFEAISGDKTYNEFLTELAKENASKELEFSANVIKSKKHEPEFNLSNIIKSAVDPRQDLGKELEFKSERVGAFTVPSFAFQEILHTIDTPASADIIQENYRGDLLIKLLRQESQIINNITHITGLNGITSIPKDETDIEAKWGKYGGIPDDSELNFEKITFSPKPLIASIRIDRTMLKMSSIDLNAFALNKIKEAIKRTLCKTIFYGNGDDIDGLMTDDEIAVIPNFMQAPDFNKALGFVSVLDSQEIDSDNAKWFINGVDANTLSTTLKTQESFLLDRVHKEFAGYTYHKENHLKQGDIAFGDFKKIYLASFGTLDVTPLLLPNNVVLLQVFYDADLKITNKKAFALSKGAGRIATQKAKEK